MTRLAIPVSFVFTVLVGPLTASALLPCASPTKPIGLPTAIVERVSDGDTVIIRFMDGRRERTRLIGIDTPEVHRSTKLERDAQRSGRDRAVIQRLGRRAAAFTREVLDQQVVELEQDVQWRDRYGRLLAYLWRDLELANLVIVREGYAQVLTVPPNVKYEAVFRSCQRVAREAGHGLWATK